MLAAASDNRPAGRWTNARADDWPLPAMRTACCASVIILLAVLCVWASMSCPLTRHRFATCPTGQLRVSGPTSCSTLAAAALGSQMTAARWHKSSPGSGSRFPKQVCTVTTCKHLPHLPVASFWDRCTPYACFARRWRQGRQSCFALSDCSAADAMDSVFPCVAEEWLRPIMQNKFSNPAKLNFQYASQ